MLTKTLVTLACFAAFVLLTVRTVSAQTLHFEVVVDGDQAGTGSPGTGSANVLFNSVTRDISIAGTFAGLDGLVTLAHLHVDTQAIPIVMLTHSEDTDDFSGSSNIQEEFVATILNGGSYINLHSTAVPGGEIRGYLLNPTTVLELGDVNRDIFIDFSDIAPFIEVLSSGEYQAEADVNGDLAVTFGDIAPFILRLAYP